MGLNAVDMVVESRAGRRESLAALIAAQVPGHSLSQCFYNDPGIFERDMERMVLGHWHCAGHASSVANPGDFFTIEIGRESVIIVRGKDNQLRALLNVCRHRGSRVCTEQAGSTRGGFVCPYHAWFYDTDGQLKAARQFPEGSSRDDYGLKQVHLEVIEGLVFICFAAVPPGLGHLRRALAAGVGQYGWKDARVAHRQSYTIDANWKLVLENYWECYHCSPAHVEFSRAHATARSLHGDPELIERMTAKAAAMGITFEEMDHLAPLNAPGEEPADCYRSPLEADCVTGSEDGKPLAPLMGRFTGYDGGVTFNDCGPTSNFLAYPDHGMMYRFMPRSVDRTDMEVIWLVRGDAVEAVDYQLDRLTWLWHVTSLADKRIIDLNQQGVSSAYYQPGPYTEMECWTQRFVEWYLAEIS